MRDRFQEIKQRLLDKLLSIFSALQLPGIACIQSDLFKLIVSVENS